MIDHAVVAFSICEAVRSHRFTYSSELELHDRLATLFDDTGFTVPVLREVDLSPRDRIDFLIGTVGVEVKIGGTWQAAARQLQRYAASPVVEHLVLVTSRVRHVDTLVRTEFIGGKRLWVASLLEASL